jgi:hypothetical protein
MTRFLSFAFAVALTLVVGCDASKSGPQGAGGVEPGGKPKLEIVGGDVVDWGNVPPGVLEKVVKITNTGTDTLKISEVKPSCGCTTAPLDKKVLLPGDTASVKVSVDVKNSSGSVHKNLTVFSNDSTNPALAVSLKANLIRQLTAIPEFFPMTQDASAGKEFATSVALKNTGSQPISIGPPRLADAAEMLVRFDMTSPTVVQPGDSTTLVAHVRPLKSGVATSEVIVPTDSKTMPSMDVRLTVSAK